MTTDDLNEAESPNGTAACAVSRAVPCSGLEGLSVWLVETIRWDAHREQGNHSESYIVAKDIQSVWEWLAIDRSDEGVEIRSVTHKTHVLAVIPHIQNANVDLPDTAAQDSAPKSNSPAVSG